MAYSDFTKTFSEEILLASEDVNKIQNNIEALKSENITIDGDKTYSGDNTHSGDNTFSGDSEFNGLVDCNDGIKTNNFYSKEKLFTGNLDGSGTATIATGLTFNKIISYSGTVINSVSGIKISLFDAGSFYINSSNEIIIITSGSSYYNQPYRIIIEYET